MNIYPFILVDISFDKILSKRVDVETFKICEVNLPRLNKSRKNVSTNNLFNQSLSHSVAWVCSLYYSERLAKINERSLPWWTSHKTHVSIFKYKFLVSVECPKECVVKNANCKIVGVCRWVVKIMEENLFSMNLFEIILKLLFPIILII